MSETMPTPLRLLLLGMDATEWQRVAEGDAPATNGWTGEELTVPELAWAISMALERMDELLAKGGSVERDDAEVSRVWIGTIGGHLHRVRRRQPLRQANPIYLHMPQRDASRPPATNRQHPSIGGCVTLVHRMGYHLWNRRYLRVWPLVALVTLALHTPAAAGERIDVEPQPTFECPDCTDTPPSREPGVTTPEQWADQSTTTTTATTTAPPPEVQAAPPAVARIATPTLTG